MVFSTVCFIDLWMELYLKIVFFNTGNFFDRGVYKRKQTVQYHSQKLTSRMARNSIAENGSSCRLYNTASTRYQLKMSWHVVQHCCEGAWCFYAEWEYAGISSPVG